MTRTEFVARYGAIARRVTAGTGIFPETLLAQAAVESANGRSLLSSKYNNFFGIKAGGSWKGPKVVLKTREVIVGRDVVIPDAFRVYGGFADSARDYVRLLTVGRNFAAKKVASAPNYAEQIKRLKAAGYATDPNYVSIITKVADKVKVPAGGNLVAVAVLAFGGWQLGKYKKWW